MGLLFNPKVELRVYVGTDLYTIKGLYMDFDILARRDSKPNTAKITVQNLSETTRNLMSADHQGIEFFAGYGDEDPVLIFRGSTVNVFHQKPSPGTTWYTEIYALEGEKELKSAIFNRSYEAGTEVRQVIEDVSKSMGIPTEIDFFEVSDVLSESLTLSGLAKDVLDMLTGDYDLRWSIQQGILEITPFLSSVSSQPTAVVLTSDTGMIESPILTERQPIGKKGRAKKKKKGQKEEMVPGVRVLSLLNADIRPNRIIEIRARQTVNNQLGKLSEQKRPVKSADGFYICDKVRYYGDNHGGPFLAEMEADRTFE